MEKSAKIFVSGHKGMVGSALVKELESQGYTNLLLADRSQLDLIDQKAVHEFFEKEKPEYVFHIAAKVGGIMGNRTYPADFMYENIQLNTNVIHAAHEAKVTKLINFGSICIYPKFAEIPVKEESLLTGELEYTNEGYAIVKIAGLMLCKKYKEQYGDNFVSVMPDNIYGRNDNFHPENSHVIPMLMDRLHKAKVNNDPETVVWGSGKPTRGFIFADDVATGLIFIMNNYDDLAQINIGTGEEISIRELAETLKDVIGFTGELKFDTKKPDGTPRRYLDTSKLTNLGWEAKYSLNEGLKLMYEWYLANQDNLAKR